jgi:molecular chaperone GrpE (heat shock protein)
MWSGYDSPEEKENERLREQLKAARAEIARLQAELDAAYTRLANEEQECITAMTERDAARALLREACNIGLALSGYRHTDTPDEYVLAQEAKLRAMERAHLGGEEG